MRAGFMVGVEVRVAGQIDPPANRLTRFTDRAAAYVKHRPSYPAGAIDAVLGRAGDASGMVAADIGAGTGISSRLLSARGVRVFAVEPNEAMRAHGVSERDALITWIDGTGEATGLEDESVDVVLYAQAFHWVKVDAALAEAARILKPGGRLALMWNVQDLSDAFTREYKRIIKSHATEPPRSPSFLDVPPDPFPCAGWRDVERHRTVNEQVMDEDGLIGRAMSASYCPNAGEGRAALERELRESFRQFGGDGVVRLKYSCDVTVARRGV